MVRVLNWIVISDGILTLANGTDYVNNFHWNMSFNQIDVLIGVIGNGLGMFKNKWEMFLDNETVICKLLSQSEATESNF